MQKNMWKPQNNLVVFFETTNANFCCISVLNGSLFCHLIRSESFGSTPFLEVHLLMHNYLASPAAPKALTAVIISLLPQKHKTHSSKTVKSLPLCPWVVQLRVECVVREKNTLWCQTNFHYFVRCFWYIVVCLPEKQPMVAVVNSK